MKHLKNDGERLWAVRNRATMDMWLWLHYCADVAGWQQQVFVQSSKYRWETAARLKEREGLAGAKGLCSEGRAVARTLSYRYQ